MAGNKRFFAPRFINRFDRWLLLNKPETWSARAHLVLYYVILLIALLAVIEFCYPDDPRTSTGIINWALFTSIVSLIGLVAWMIYLLRFNVFKRYGITSPFNRLKTFLLYFFSVGIIGFAPFVDSGVESLKAHRAFPEAQIKRDVNRMNEIIVRLEKDSIDPVWKRDTFRVVDSVPGKFIGRPEWVTVNGRDDGESVTYADTVAAPKKNRWVPYYKGKAISLIDTADYRESRQTADSLMLLDDSTIIVLNCPTYIFVDYRDEGYGPGRLWTSIDIYRHVIVNYHEEDKAKIRRELAELSDRYRNPLYEENNYTSGNTYGERLKKRYLIYRVESGLNNITERMNFTRGTALLVQLRVLFYTTLFISLLLFVFRHSTARTFFLTLLAMAVLAILTALIVALLHVSTSGFFSIFLVYFILFLLGSIAGSVLKVRSVFAGIALNLAVLMLPFIPLLVVATIFSRHQYGRMYLSEPARMMYWLGMAEWMGPFLLLLSMVTWIHWLYRRWYALPEL